MQSYSPTTRNVLLGQVIKLVRRGKVVHVQFMAKSLYPIVRLVTVAWVAVRCCATLCLSLLR